MRKSDKIIKKLMDHYNNGNEICIPNFYFSYEMDLFRLTNTGYVVEYEVKISRNDFFQDFKKGNKHECLKNGKLITNRFYFVVPTGLIKVEEIPDYAGLIYIDIENYPKVEIIKNAPLLHKKKKEDEIFFKNLLTKMIFRESVTYRKNKGLQRKNKEMKKLLEKNNIIYYD